MLLKNFSIELAHANPKALCVGLHPGTVDTHLSKPYQKNVQPENLFTAKHSATALLNVINKLDVTNSGGLFSWDGKEIQP